MSENDETETIVDNFEIIVESEDECNCGLQSVLEYKRFIVLLDIKKAQTALDKLLGQLELLDELINADNEEEEEEDI